MAKLQLISTKLVMKRGRPTTEDIARIERAILSTARDMFLAEGFDGVAMEGVAAATGISRTTLYNRYATKADLFRAVIQETLSRWYERPGPRKPSDFSDLRSVLRARVADMAAVLVDPLFRAFHTLTLSNRHRFPELGSMMHTLGYRNSVNLLADDIRRSATLNDTRVERPDMIAQVIINAIYGWFVQHDLLRELTAKEIAAQGYEVIDVLMLCRDKL